MLISVSEFPILINFVDGYLTVVHKFVKLFLIGQKHGIRHGILFRYHFELFASSTLLQVSSSSSRPWKAVTQSLNNSIIL